MELGVLRRCIAMGDEQKKCCGGCGGGLKKFLMAVIILPVLAYGGWFGYAKVTGNPDLCLCTKVIKMVNDREK
jgi:hypothetical protein